MIRRHDSHRESLSWVKAVSTGVVVLCVAGLLGAGARFGNHRQPVAGETISASLEPVVDVGAAEASVWNCPGPLQVDDGSAASVSIANPGGDPASVAITIAETLALPTTTPHPLPTRSEHVVVPAHSSRVVPIPAESVPSTATTTTTTTTARRHHRKRHGHTSANPPPSAAPVPVDAAVSLTVSGASVGVAESVSSLAGTLAGPCALGSGTSGYVASGVTAGSSQVAVGLFNPEATPAVVNVTVGTGEGAEAPEAFQGILVQPDALVVLDVAKSVAQRARLAVSAQATVGRVVVGTATSEFARFFTQLKPPHHTYFETGHALAVGIGRAQSHFVIPVSTQITDGTVGVRLFDPGSRPAVVTMHAYGGAGGPGATLTVSVAPGETATALPPVLAGSHGNRTEIVSVSTRHGVGIAAEREVLHTLPKQRVAFGSWSVVRGPSRTWILPSLTAGARAHNRVVITNSSPSTETVQLSPLGASAGAAGPSDSVTVAPGSTVSVAATSISSLRHGQIGVLVQSSGPTLVTGVLGRARHQIWPGVETAIPGA